MLQLYRLWHTELSHDPIFLQLYYFEYFILSKMRADWMTFGSGSRDTAVHGGTVKITQFCVFFMFQFMLLALRKNVSIIHVFQDEESQWLSWSLNRSGFWWPLLPPLPPVSQVYTEHIYYIYFSWSTLNINTVNLNPRLKPFASVCRRFNRLVFESFMNGTYKPTFYVMTVVNWVAHCLITSADFPCTFSHTLIKLWQK